MSDHSPQGIDRSRDAVLIAIVSFAVLVCEIAITRLMSVVLWYHFAFLAISLAMLALGAPGVWFSLRDPGPRALRRCLLLAGIALPTAVAIVAQSGDLEAALRGVLGEVGPGLLNENLRILIAGLALLVPFLLLGSVICLILMRAPGARVGRIYAADLFGAMAGAAAVVPLLHLVPTPTALAALGFLPLLAAWIGEPRRPLSPLVIAGLLVVTIVWGRPYQVRTSKAYRETGLDILYERWTPTARLTVFEGLVALRGLGMDQIAFGWGMGSRYEPRDIEQLWIDQDGSAGTPVTRFRGSLEELDHLRYDVTSVGYQLCTPERVAIVGAGGGRDILTALVAGSKWVDAIELNPAMIEIVTDLYGAFSGDVYHQPGVNAVVSEGRSFFSGTASLYDLIQISLIDSFASTTAGAYALTENYLYTVEALRLYLAHLKPKGIVTISRWMQGAMQLESMRLVLLAQEALRQEGVEDPASHLAVLQGGSVATVLVSKQAFDDSQIRALDEIADLRGFERHWPPSLQPPPKSRILDVLTHGPEAYESLGLYLAPPVDDRPFFFQNVRAFDELDPTVFKRLSFNDDAARLPRFLIASVGGLTATLFFLPFLFAGRLRRGQGFWRGTLYFLAVGVAFMLVEVPLLQRFVLYLGHPSYATTVVLSTLLLGASLGSWSASRVSPDRITRLRFLLPGAVVLVNLGLATLFDRTIGASIWVRVLAASTATVPLGFLLGFAFPVGMMRFGEGHRAWFWAVNGSAGVLASVSAVAVASYIGLSGVAFAGAAAYVVACLVLPARSRPAG